MRQITRAYLFVICMCIACSNENKPGGAESDAAPNNGTTTSGEPNKETGDGGTALDSGQATASAVCGNKKVDDKEECDDGNMNDSDGCTSLCMYSCHDDSECAKDVCSGAGAGCDKVSHSCTSGGADAKADGEKCGDNAWCYHGKCTPLACGNGVKQGDEECDDGNSNEADGCTKKCTYTCGSKDVAGRVDIYNVCDPTATCDTKTHMWIKGAGLPDGTPCNRGAGYCSSGVCVSSVCGDGKKDPNEACDDGPDNGSSGKCSKTCTIGVCGDNKIDGPAEECDDGNTKNFDGCDFRCKAEVTYRLSSVKISTENAHAGCLYANTPKKGNAFKDLFPLDANTNTSAILDLFNSLLTGEITTEESIPIFQLFEVDDYSFSASDPVAFFGMSIGKSQNAWPTDTSAASTLDIPLVSRKSYFENDQPKNSIPISISIENAVPVVRTTGSFSTSFGVMGMNWELSNLMVSRLDVDKVFSRLPEPPVTPATFKVPETMGNAFATPPTGYMCGAFLEKAFASLPLIEELSTICIDQWAGVGGAGAYRPCTGNSMEELMTMLKEGRCDSFLTLFRGGCSALGVPILNPIGDPDVDVNGDGTTDAYSVVVNVSAQRARLVGLTDDPS
jgi:cysteine-rich repeat protein